jgi:hypothetical protein
VGPKGEAITGFSSVIVNGVTAEDEGVTVDAAWGAEETLAVVVCDEADETGAGAGTSDDDGAELGAGG